MTVDEHLEAILRLATDRLTLEGVIEASNRNTQIASHFRAAIDGIKANLAMHWPVWDPDHQRLKCAGCNWTPDLCTWSKHLDVLCLDPRIDEKHHWL